MRSIWPDIAAGMSPDHVPITYCMGTPMQAKVAWARSASSPTSFEKYLGSRMLNGTLSPSWPILIVLPARPGYLVASFAGSQAASSALAPHNEETSRKARQAVPRRIGSTDL